jgi:hypothetical protein
MQPRVRSTGPVGVAAHPLREVMATSSPTWRSLPNDCPCATRNQSSRPVTGAVGYDGPFT